MPTKEEQKEMLNQINKVVASDFLESTLTFKCRFLGQDRSASFRNGQEYSLEIRRPVPMESAKGWKLIIVLPKYIPYTSIDTFLNNWEIIK